MMNLPGLRVVPPRDQSPLLVPHTSWDLRGGQENAQNGRRRLDLSGLAMNEPTTVIIRLKQIGSDLPSNNLCCITNAWRLCMIFFAPAVFFQPVLGKATSVPKRYGQH